MSVDKHQSTGRVDRLVNACAQFFVYRPVWCVLLIFALAIPTLWGLGKLKADFSYRVWFDPDDPILRAFDNFEQKFGNDDQTAIVVNSPSGIFDIESAKLLNSLTKDLWKVSQIIRVDSLSNFMWSRSDHDEIRVEPFLPQDEKELTVATLEKRREAAMKDPFLPGYLISPDAKTAVIFASIQPMHTGTADYLKIMKEIRGILDKYKKAGGDHVFHLSGSAALEDAFYSVIRDDLMFNVPASGLMIMILLLFCFRNISGVILPFIVLWSSTGMTLGLAHLFGAKFNAMLSIVPNVIIAVAIADVVHLLAAYFSYLRGGLDRKQAALLSYKKNLVPTFLANITSCVGFMTLLFTNILPIQYFGVLTGLGTMLAWVMSLLVLGPCMAYLPLRAAADSRLLTVDDETHFIKPSAGMFRYVDLLTKFRKPIIWTFCILSAVFMVIGFRNEINSNPMKMFRNDVPIQQANQFLQGNFGAVMGPDIMLDAGSEEGAKDPAFLKKVEELELWIRSHPFVTKTVSIVDIIKKTNSTLHNDNLKHYEIPQSKKAVAEALFLYQMDLPQGLELNNRISLDSRFIRMTVLWTLQDSKSNLAAMHEIEAKAKDMGLPMSFSGKQLLHQMMNESVLKAFYGSMGVVEIGIFLLLVYIFGSWKLGAIAMIPNIFPLMIGFGMVYLLKSPLDLGTILVFSICLGIAIDDTIHVVHSYKQLEKQGVGPRDAVANIFSTTAPSLIFATLILVACFGTFIFAKFIPTVNFGIMTGLILSVALISDLILTPALLLSGVPPPVVGDGAQSSVPDIPTSGVGAGEVIANPRVSITS